MCAKLKFYYGTVCSAKTMTLLSIAHNYETCKYNVFTVKPSLDTRSVMIETRSGVPPRKPTLTIKSNESFNDYIDQIKKYANVILIDECQFLTSNQIDELREIANTLNIDVLCFGLRTDSNSHLFEASKRLFELSDELIEVKTICSVCGKHAVFSKKVTESKSLVDCGWDNYIPVCSKHFN